MKPEHLDRLRKFQADARALAERRKRDRVERCAGSGGRVMLSVGQQRQTGGYARPNVATDVQCTVCGRKFERARITYTDHGIPTPPQGLIPRHKPGGNR